MKSTYFYFFILLLNVQFLNAQIGIGTSTPQGIFHVDPQSNTPATTPTVSQVSDDFIVENTSGNIGIGTLTPKVKVDLRNSNNNAALGLGNTTLSAAEAGKGAMRYNGSVLQYSNGTQWIDLVLPTKIKTVVIATKTNQSTFVYGGGGYTDAGGCNNCTINGVPHRTPAYITNWTTKYNNNISGGTFNASTGVFTANRSGTFTATFTFALENGMIRAWNGSANAIDANQIEAIWRVYDTNGTTEINSIKCANTFPSDSRQNSSGTNGTGSAMAGSNCTGSIYLEAGQSIRPAVWIDLSPTGTTTKPFDLTTSNGASIYNNLTIVEN